jgi:hypothetical protein
MTLLSFPRPAQHISQIGAPAPIPPDPPGSREEQKSRLRLVQPRGISPMPMRQPYVGQLTTVTSPVDATVTFDIKRCGVAENLARQNMSSTMRYIEQDSVDSNNKYVTERDYPLGNMRRDTILLALAGWNITDLQDRPVPITKETLVTYLDPKEFDWLYDQVLEVNPMWKPNGEEDVKNA